MHQGMTRASKGFCRCLSSSSSTRLSTDSTHKGNPARPTRFLKHIDDDAEDVDDVVNDTRRFGTDSQHTDARLMEDVADFAAFHGLSQHLSLFEKAAILLSSDGTDDIALSPNVRHFLELEVSSQWTQPHQLYFAIVVCSFGAIMQGWSQTGANGATLGFPVAFDIAGETAWEEALVGAINAAPFVCVAVL